MRNRRRDAKHPVVVAVMGSFVGLAASQILFGASGSNVISSMPEWSQVLFSWLLMVSTIACFVSAWVHREPLGAHIERAGMFGCSVALLAYSFAVPDSVSSWSTSMTPAFTGLAIGCAIRAGLVWRMIRHRETW